MSKRNLGERIKLTSYEEMFGSELDNIGSGQFVQKLYEDKSTSGQSVQKLEDGHIIEIPIEELHTFKDHPFRVIDDEKMSEMVDSIKQKGILVPGIVRALDDGGYEIISGHRRTHAAKLAGLTTVPMMVKDYGDDEATIIMVDANIQREDILPSEKAKAYNMKYEAIKHQGSEGGSSLEVVGELGGDGVKTVQRYIRLSKLTDDMLDLVDKKKIGFGQGIDFSFLSEEAQGWVYDVVMQSGCNVTGVQSAIIKERFKAGELTATLVSEILCYENPKKKRKITFSAKTLNRYFSASANSEDIENLIFDLLDDWKSKGGEL